MTTTEGPLVGGPIILGETLQVKDLAQSILNLLETHGAAAVQRQAALEAQLRQIQQTLASIQEALADQHRAIRAAVELAASDPAREP